MKKRRDVMEKRRWEKLGIETPLLGMGLMRLPMKDGIVDDEIAVQMVDEMYNAGVRYFDTAYVYMNGENERFARRALVDRYPRDSFWITSKLPLDHVKEPEDAQRIFEESCERLGVDYIDFYLYHALNGSRWEKYKAMGLDDFLIRLKEAGRIRYAGFSFHGSPDDLRMILSDRDDWDFVQLQINYYDWYNDTSKELYEIAEQKGVPVVIMEPVRGSALHQLGDDVREAFQKVRPGDSNVKWAMRFVGSLPNVKVVLSGVSELEHVRENVGFYSPLEPMTDADIDTIKGVMDIILSRPFVPCTGCHYCDGCPVGVDIVHTFRAYNEYAKLYNAGGMMWQYFGNVPEANRADQCIGCGACAAKCPQFIDIPGELRRCHDEMMAVKAASDKE